MATIHHVRVRRERPLLAGVGETPIVEVGLVVRGRLRRVRLKLEGSNPTGSIKARTAVGLMRQLDRQGLLDGDTLLVESTSGNLGVALAMITSSLRIGFVAIVDPRTSVENVAKMQSLGAQVHRVTEPDGTGGYLLTRLQQVRQVLQDNPRAVWTNQYGNTANPLAHYRTTGPELLSQAGRHLDVVFIAVSTCGTLAGVAACLRTFSPRTRIVAVDVRGSVIFGAAAHARLLTGIGSSRAPEFSLDGLYDEVIRVGDWEAMSYCRELRRATGINVGGSSGAVLAASARFLASHREEVAVACLCPDTGDNYSSSIFDDEWLRLHGIDPDAPSLGPTESIEPLEAWR